MQLRQFLLEALALGVQNGVLLALALLAPDADLQLGGLRRRQLPRLRRQAAAGDELAVGSARRRGLPLPAPHRDPVVALLPQPGQVGRGRDAGIHHHQRPGRRVSRAPGELAQGRLQRAGFGDIARQDLGAAREAALVEGHGQRDQRAVPALLLRAPELQVVARRAVVMDIGEVVEANRLRPVEEGLLARAESGLEAFADSPQAIADAMQEVVGRRAAVVEAEQFEGGAAPGEPGLGGALGGGAQHAGEDQGAGVAGVAVGEAEVPQDVGEAQLAQSGEAEALAADGAGRQVRERVQLDGGDRAGGGRGGRGQAAVLQLPGDSGGDGQQLGVRGHQRLGALIEGLDELGEGGPLGAGHGEIDSEVEVGDLLDAGTDAHGGAEAMAAAGAVFRGMGRSSADIHGGQPMMANPEANTRRTKDNRKRTCHYTAGAPGPELEVIENKGLIKNRQIRQTRPQKPRNSGITLGNTCNLLELKGLRVNHRHF